jgi:hypothetical protein
VFRVHASPKGGGNRQAQLSGGFLKPKNDLLLMITFSVGGKFSAFDFFFIPPEGLHGIRLEMSIGFDEFRDKVIEQA